MASHLRRFGILLCPRCAISREFIAYDKDVKHITDAMCIECGYVFGRVDQYDELAGLRPEDVPGVPNPTMRRAVPVISDAQAAVAARQLARDARDLADLPTVDPPAIVAREAAILLPPPPAPWRPGLHAVPTGAPPPAGSPDGEPAGPPHVSPPDGGAPRQGAARDSLRSPGAAPPISGARSEDFMRHFARERSTNGRS